MANKKKVEQPEEVCLMLDYMSRLVRPETKQVKDSIWISASWDSPSDVASRLLEAEKILSESHCEVNSPYEEGDAQLYVHGWRPMTDKEIAVMEVKLPEHRIRVNEIRAMNEERDRQRYEELRERFEAN